MLVTLSLRLISITALLILKKIGLLCLVDGMANYNTGLMPYFAQPFPALLRWRRRVDGCKYSYQASLVKLRVEPRYRFQRSPDLTSSITQAVIASLRFICSSCHPPLVLTSVRPWDASRLREAFSSA
jgi:hypothetical protein